jgi:hypothetical protein
MTAWHHDSKIPTINGTFNSAYVWHDYFRYNILPAVSSTAKRGEQGTAGVVLMVELARLLDRCQMFPVINSGSVSDLTTHHCYHHQVPWPAGLHRCLRWTLAGTAANRVPRWIGFHCTTALLLRCQSQWCPWILWRIWLCSFYFSWLVSEFIVYRDFFGLLRMIRIKIHAFSLSASWWPPFLVYLFTYSILISSWFFISLGFLFRFSSHAVPLSLSYLFFIFAVMMNL